MITMAMSTELPAIPDSLPVVKTLVTDAIAPRITELSASDEKVTQYRRYTNIQASLISARDELTALNSRVKGLEKSLKTEFGDNPDWSEVEAMTQQRDKITETLLSLLQAVYGLTAGDESNEQITTWADKLMSDLRPAPVAVSNTQSSARAEQNRDIRAWARQRGYKVSDRGAISEQVVNAYFTQHPTVVKIDA